MKAFHCDNCGSLVFFENFQCVRCGEALGFLPDVLDLSALLKTEDNQVWLALTPDAQQRPYRFCQNTTQHQVCNWLIPTDDPEPFCEACRLNEVIPALDIPENHELWHKLEIAKRRVIYTLLHLGLPLGGTPDEDKAPLRFRFLNDAPGTLVLTGHNQGVITLNIAEADDAERERRRVALREPLRTLLGHLRHEVGHYYWDQLIANTPHLDEFRKLFGDETQDYGQALENYYRQGPPPDWQLRTVSAYASAHPWEDWAETWAHYQHIVDTIETAGSFGVTLRPKHPDSESMSADPDRVSPTNTSFGRVLDHWFPLTYAFNELNRGMGLPDLYPFVISTPAIAKLNFIHEVIHQAGQSK